MIFDFCVEHPFTTIEKLLFPLIDGFPFSVGLRSFIITRPDFWKSLKLAQPNRFVLLPLLLISHLPDSEKNDGEILGLWYWDIEKNIFKQDYIMNVGSNDKIFVSYSIDKFVTKTENVKTIQSFFNTIGAGGKYYTRDNTEKSWMHHYRPENELPEPVKDFLEKYPDYIQQYLLLLG